VADDLHLRRAQTLSPFGVGAIIDILGHSLVAADIRHWTEAQCLEIPAERLRSIIGADAVRMAPALPPRWRPGMPAAGVPFVRFPRWVFCPSCRSMTHLRESADSELPRCGSCGTGKGTALTPMRFVRVCGHGHLDDIDWRWWAHRRGDTATQKQCADAKHLAFRTDSKRGGSLASLIVECRTCKASSDLEDITRTKLKCRGTQPWISTSDATSCPEGVAHAVQRGATSVHFPHVRSAIDIPPFSNYSFTGGEVLALRGTNSFANLCDLDGASALFDIILDQCASASALPREAVLREWERQRTGAASTNTAPADEEQLRAEEWSALRAKHADTDPRDSLQTEVVPLLAIEDAFAAAIGTATPISDLVLVTKLREVRALEGFSRYERLADVPADLGGTGGHRVNWRPGIEVFGEGILFGLNSDRLLAWEQRDDVRTRAGAIERYRCESAVAARLPEATPRFVLIHTLAHLLMRELSLVAGYGTASLRERIYAAESPELRGALIYTADGDSEGSLGGLVRQGEPQAFAGLVAQALLRARWCSLDPICSEMESQGTDSLSRAACHACSLAPETSCEAMNGLLDRGLVVGDGIGFFAPEVASLEASGSLL
jgi:hypothetical protein